MEVGERQNEKESHQGGKEDEQETGAQKSAKKTSGVSSKAPSKSVTVKDGKWHVSGKEVTERDIVAPLNEDLMEAWEKLRAFAAELGPQRIYASHRSIMFSKKVCYFYVRPQKSFIEVVIFLPRKVEGLKMLQSTAAGKHTNLFKLTHPDQVEEPLTDWLREAYDDAPDAK